MVGTATKTKNVQAQAPAAIAGLVPGSQQLSDATEFDTVCFGDVQI